MARVIRERTGADYGLAVAALPQRRQILRATRNWKARCRSRWRRGENVRVKGFPLSGHPAIVRTRAAKQALNMLRLALLNHGHHRKR